MDLQLIRLNEFYNYSGIIFWNVDGWGVLVIIISIYSLYQWGTPYWMELIQDLTKFSLYILVNKLSVFKSYNCNYCNMSYWKRQGNSLINSVIHKMKSNTLASQTLAL